MPQSDTIIFLPKLCKQWKTSTAPAKISIATWIWEQYPYRLALFDIYRPHEMHTFVFSAMAHTRNRAAAQLQPTNLQRAYLLQFVSRK